MKIIARRPSAEDIEYVSQLVTDASVFSPEEIEVAKELVEECLTKGEAQSGYSFVFSESDGKVTGYACYGRIPFTENSYDLYWIVTSPAYQGHGIGGQLLHAVERQIPNGTLYAETSGRSDYSSAHAFYKKYGFANVARFEDFYRAGDDKLVFQKKCAIIRHNSIPIANEDSNR